MNRRRELQELTQLAIPLSLVQLGYQLNGVVDTAFAGRINDVALGATGIGTMVFFIFPALGLGVCMGLDPLVAQALGAGERRLARHIMWQGLYTAVLLVLPVSALVILCALYLERFGIVPELCDTTRDYMYARLPSLLPFFAAVVLRSYLQADHRPWPIIGATVLTNGVNVIANFVLVFGDEGLVEVGLPAIGLEALGVRGLGWATVIATVVMFAALAAVIRRRDPGPGEDVAHRFAWPVIRKTLAIGLPFGLHLFAEIGIFAAVQVLIGGMGVVATAAHQVAISLASATFAVCVGIGSATSVQVGRAIGRHDRAATRWVGMTGIAMGAGFMTVTAIVMWVAPRFLAQTLTPDPTVVGAAAKLIVIAAAFQIVDGIQAVSSGALRGAGITRFTFVAQLLAHWVVGLPMGALLAYGAGMGVAGLWWGLTLGLASVAVVLVARFYAVSQKPIARIRV